MSEKKLQRKNCKGKRNNLQFKSIRTYNNSVKASHFETSFAQFDIFFFCGQKLIVHIFYVHNILIFENLQFELVIET